MLDKFLEDTRFVLLMEKFVKETLVLLFEKNMQFSILANTAKSRFNPELPEEIVKGFKPIVTFVLAGYTLQSARIEGENLEFEAGFGADNIGSIVTIPLNGILQIIVEDTPILINLSLPKEEQETDEGGVSRSMEALLSNPENKNLLK